LNKNFKNALRNHNYLKTEEAAKALPGDNSLDMLINELTPDAEVEIDNFVFSS
jgi:hypothetical protein